VTDGRRVITPQMKTAFGVLLIAGVAALGAQEAQTPRTVWDDVYTDTQAKRGEEIYLERCVRCHGTTLAGGTDGAGPLTGPTFKGNWNGVGLGDMVERMRLSMPLDNPATLSRQQTADVLAYILSMNQFPAGKTDLPRQTELLNQIQFRATKP
jgi:mono/diheme cytochrome c family protein